MNLKQELKFLSEKYEISSFCENDPSQFLRWYKNSVDIECASFIAALLSFGSRKQFIPKIKLILEIADKNSQKISDWLIKKEFVKSFCNSSEKFYRFYSFFDMQTLFNEISEILIKYNSLGEFVKQKYLENQNVHLSDIISQSFPNSKIVSKGKNSPNKRINMFLRWMVRQNSPVDLGLWNWFSQENLIIPLDVHVLQESINLGLLPENAKPTKKTAIILTEKLKEFFPKDPTKADFALFGLGVE